MISVPCRVVTHVADPAMAHAENGRLGRRSYHEPGGSGLRAGRFPAAFLALYEIPFNPPLEKGEIRSPTPSPVKGEAGSQTPPLVKGGSRDFPGEPALLQHQTPLALEFLKRYAGVVCGCISLNYPRRNREQRAWAKQTAVCALLNSGSDVLEGLSREAKPGAASIEIMSDSLGKPYILIDGSEGPSVSFAYEGHAMWVALGGQGSSVGIDAAQSDSFMGNYPFHRVFQEGELGNGREKEETAALIWSAKEAVVKALGCGFHLVDPLHLRVENSFGDQQASLLKVYFTHRARKRFQLRAKNPVPVWILRHRGMWVSVASIG